MSKLYKYDVDVSHIQATDCFGTFLNSLKLHIPSFAQYYQNDMWFTLVNKEEEVQDFVDNFDCEKATIELKGIYPEEPRVIIMLGFPKVNTNPVNSGVIWVNEITGQMFTCVSNAIDNNIWISSDSSHIIRPIPDADTFDILKDNSTLAFYQLNSNSKDVGGKYHGKNKNIIWKNGLEGKCASSEHDGQIQIKKLPFDSDTEAVTIGAWLNWNGTSGCMPFGFKEYNIYCYGGSLGFNTANGDLEGFDFKEYKNKWVYAMIVFKKGAYGTIYLNGIDKSHSNTMVMNQTGDINMDKAKMNNVLNIFGWSRDRGYRDFGLIERVRIINREVEAVEAYSIAEAEIDFMKSIRGDIEWS